MHVCVFACVFGHNEMKIKIPKEIMRPKVSEIAEQHVSLLVCLFVCRCVFVYVCVYVSVCLHVCVDMCV